MLTSSIGFIFPAADVAHEKSEHNDDGQSRDAYKSDWDRQVNADMLIPSLVLRGGKVCQRRRLVPQAFQYTRNNERMCVLHNKCNTRQSQIADFAPGCVTDDEYFPIFIVKHNLVGIDEIVWAGCYALAT